MSIIFPLNQNFLFHRSQQTGGSINQAPPINILRRGPIVYYSIYFQQHKKFYDFYDEGIVDSFFCSVQRSFTLSALNIKLQGYFKLKNYQQIEITEIENITVRLIKVHVGKYFNQFARGQIKEDKLKRVIINGGTGSSWLFKHFLAVLKVKCL